MSEYFEFSITDEKRFKDLEKVFYRLKIDKEDEKICDEEQYLNLFDEEALKYFRRSTPEEDAFWTKRWFATLITTRQTDQSLNRGWDFGSMIEAFKNGEYSLLSCEMVSSKVARLNFYAEAYPYGGTGCMQALLESFGFKVLMINDGSCPPHPP